MIVDCIKPNDTKLTCLNELKDGWYRIQWPGNNTTVYIVYWDTDARVLFAGHPGNELDVLMFDGEDNTYQGGWHGFVATPIKVDIMVKG